MKKWCSKFSQPWTLTACGMIWRTFHLSEEGVRSCYTYEFVPRVLSFDVVGQAAFHDVDAVVAARLKSRKSLACWTRVHFLDGIQALLRYGNLERSHHQKSLLTRTNGMRHSKLLKAATMLSFFMFLFAAYYHLLFSCLPVFERQFWEIFPVPSPPPWTSWLLQSSFWARLRMEPRSPYSRPRKPCKHCRNGIADSWPVTKEVDGTYNMHSHGMEKLPR